MTLESHATGNEPPSPHPFRPEPAPPARRGAGSGGKDAPFTREEFDRSETDLLSKGRWGNADLHLFRKGMDAWVVKDFLHCPTGVRQIWGAYMTGRELLALRRLSGIPGFPQDAFRLDRYAIAYRFVPGSELGQAKPEFQTARFFEQLESLVDRMHGRGIAHLDIRTGGNVLVTDQGTPLILDFQSHVSLTGLPAFLRRILVAVDRAGVYKHWSIRAPGTLGEVREAHLRRMNVWRRYWVLKGYLGFKPGPAPQPRAGAQKEKKQEGP